MPDVTIIGAGPAGSVAAILLARRAWRVTLLEQHEFPRDKVCGECVSALGIEVLTRLNIASDLRLLQPVELVESLIHAPGGQSVRIPLGRPMWGLSRGAMDTALLRLARTAGAEVRQPMRCERINPGVGPDRPTVYARDLLTNHMSTWHTDWILVADGKGSLLPSRPRPTRDFGIKSHYVGVDGPRNAIELFGVHGHYGGIAPIEPAAGTTDPRWNVAFSVPAAVVQQSRGDVDALFAGVIGQNRNLASRFAAARRVGEWLASPLPRFGVDRTWPQCVIPLGNAAAALEPIGGEGMGLAMRSAELTAEYLLRSTGEAGPIGALRDAFARLWRARRHACRTAAMLVSRPAVAGAAVDWLNANDTFAGQILGLLGKS